MEETNEILLDENEELWDKGVEDGEEEIDKSYILNTLLGKYIEELTSVGIFYHDATETITSGGMRDTIIFLREFFKPENFIPFLSSLPILVVEKFSGIIYSDEIPDEDSIHEVLSLFNREVSINSDLSLVVYYADLYFSNEKFVELMRNLLKEMRESVKLSLGSLATEKEIQDYSNLVKKHVGQVKFLVNQIVEKSNYPFDKELISGLLENHDKDLLYSENLNFLSLDKGLFGGVYHKFSKHPAIDNFYNHKISSFHHIECYLMNGINLEDELETYLNFIPIMICDVYDTGMTFEVFKLTVENTFRLLNPGEEFLDKIRDFVNLIVDLPLDN